MDERDVFISPEHLAELKERINDKISVPQVFINGQHIGVSISINLKWKSLEFLKGFDEVEELNETGKLRELLRHIPVRQYRLLHSSPNIVTTFLIYTTFNVYVLLVLSNLSVLFRK